MNYLNKFIILFYLFLASACSEYSDYSVDNFGVSSITPKDTHITEVEVKKWKVGPLRKQEVTKGVQVKFSLPYLKKDDLLQLIEKKGINSWIVRVSKRSPTGSRVISSFFIPLALPGDAEQARVRIKQVKNGFLNLFYAAASISPRFEKFQCPAFDHNKKIKNAKIVEDKSYIRRIVISTGEEAGVFGKVSSFGYRPQVINAGMELRGRYFIEIALYNTASKTKKSSFIQYPESVELSGEIDVPLTGCDDFKIPAHVDRGNLMKMFKWNKGRRKK